MRTTRNKGDKPMPERPQLRRDILPRAGQQPLSAETNVRREGSGDVVPADRAAAATGRCRKCPRHPARRRRLRRVERLRRPDSTRGSPSGSPRTASSTTASTRPRSVRRRARRCSRTQPPFGGHGRDHRDRDLGARLQLGAAEHCAPLAETLKLNGYSTAQFGKCHEVPVWETSPMGPFSAWPTGSGSSTSTASSAARRTSTRRRSTRTRCRSSRTGRPRRAITSPRT